MIYSKIEKAFVKTKQTFNYYSRNVSLEIILEVETVGQKRKFTQKLTINLSFFLAQLSPN